ncbi:hypothetical protein BH10BDE1_BH10BDE1_04300 [soil metagenome]
MNLRISSMLIAVLSISGCATYNYAERVKLVAFSDDFQKGRSVGNIRGEDCTWNILGYPLGGAPTVDRAFQHARRQTDGGSLAGSLSSASSRVATAGELRYVVNLSTANDGFNAVLFGKQCIVVTGIGYR